MYFVLPTGETILHTPGVPNLGDARGLKVMFTWVHLYQWGDAIDVKGDADTKRLGTPGIHHSFIRIKIYKEINFGRFQPAWN